jgi:hypothetical protein
VVVVEEAHQVEVVLEVIVLLMELQAVEVLLNHL